MKTKRRISRLAVGFTVGFAGLAVLWWAVAVPTLVKYPSSLDVSPQYAGTFTLYVNPATAAPLATPTQAPLTIDRHIKVISSGASRVVVQETIVQKAGDLVNATQTNVYVMDRRSLKNLADSRAYAFQPANVVDRSGDYRLNLPFHTKTDGSYSIYKNEIGTTYVMKGDPSNPTTREAGLMLHNFTASVKDAPLDPAYLAELNKLVPLPAAMTLDQLKPQLKAAGLDVDAVLAALAPVLTPADVTTLTSLAAKPIPLQYVLSFDGHAAVETTTGSEVDVKALETVGAKPMLTDIATLQTVLSHYPNVPAAVDAGKALSALATAPSTKLFDYSYQQTPASVKAIAHKVKSMRNQALLAERYIPLGLLIAALLSLLGGGLVWFFRRPRGPEPAPREPATTQAAPEREPVLHGSPR